MSASQTLPPQVSLGTKTVHIWRIDLEADPARLRRLKELVSSQETAQAERYHFDRDARRFLAAHGALRSILSRYVGIEPQQVAYRETQRGKPYLADFPGLCFNLAHSQEVALAAVTTSGEIGIDVEHLRPLDDMDRLAERCFSGLEFEQYLALPRESRPQAFFDGWTRKEAFIKALGDGLYRPLQSFSVSLSPDRPAGLLEVDGSVEEAGMWTLQSIDIQPGYSAAVALRAQQITCEVMQFEESREVTHAAA